MVGVGVHRFGGVGESASVAGLWEGCVAQIGFCGCGRGETLLEDVGIC